MKKLYTAAFALTLAGSTLLLTNASAQAAQGDTQGNSATTQQGQGHRGKHGRHGRHGKMRKMMAEKLNLTDAQKSQMNTLREQTRTQAQAIKNNDALSQEQKKEQLKSLHENTRSQMDSILTPEQKQQAQQMREQWKQKRQERRGDAQQTQPQQ